MFKINTVLKSVIVGCTSLAMLIGCSEKTTIASGDLSAPTLDDYDNLTNQEEFTLTGKRSPNSTIWYQRVGQTEAVKAVAASSDESWSFTLTLNEGSNRITITASSSDETVFSDSVQAVVTLDTIAPEAPQVNDHSPSVIMNDQTSIPMNLAGIKDSDGSLDLDGTTLIQVDGQTGWTTSVDVLPGVNSFTFTSTDLAGNVSKATVVSIAGTTSSVGEVTIDPVEELTRQDPYPLSGTKPTGTSLWLVQLEAGDETPAGEPIQIAAENNNTGWSYSLDLGEGQNSFYVYAEDPTGAISAPASAQTILDTIAPAAPVLDETPESTGASTVQVTGTRAEDGNLCMRRDQEPNCTEIDAIGATTIDETIGLNDGVNFICFSSVDLAGNSSQEVCVTIYKLLGPTITILNPEAGSVISTGTVLVEAEVLGGTETGAGVANVEICLDDVSCETASGSGDIWEASLSFAGVENGSLHTITVTATNEVNVESSEILTILYQSGSLLISDTNAPGHGVSVSINHDDSGTTHVVWTDECVQFPGCITYSQGDNNAPWDVLYRKFDTNGWSEIKLVSYDPNPNRYDGDSQQSHSVIDADGLLHIVWSDSGDSLSITDYDIFHRTMNTTTGAFGDIQVVANSDKNDDEPILAAADDGSVHLVWRHRNTSMDHEILHARWTAATGWGATTEISTAAGDGNSQEADIAIDSNGDAHIVWQDDGTVFSDSNSDDDIYYRYFEDGVLQDTMLISNGGNQVGEFDDATNSDSRSPSIGISENDIVYIAWNDEIPALASSPDFDIFFHAIDSSGNFITQIYQTFDLSNAMSPYHSSRVAVHVVDDDNVVLFWSERDANNNDNVSLLKATRVGTQSSYTWSGSELIYVTNSGESAEDVAVSVDADNLAHLVWSDDLPSGDDDEVRPNNEGEDYDIFYQAVPLP